MPGEGEEDLIDPSLLRMREQIIERATGSGAGRAAIGGSMEHTDQMDIGVLLGAQQIEEAGAGALVPADDRHVAGAELPDRQRFPETAGGDAVEHGEEAAPQNKPGQDRTLHLAPGGLRRPGEKDKSGERRREARYQLAQRRAERLQFPESDVRDQDAEQDEHSPEVEAPDDRIEALIACAVRASGRELDEGPEQPQSGAVHGEHQIADHAGRQPCRTAALRRGGAVQPRGVLQDRGGLGMG